MPFRNANARRWRGARPLCGSQGREQGVAPKQGQGVRETKNKENV